jgi:hypothetical protein
MLHLLGLESRATTTPTPWQKMRREQILRRSRNRRRGRRRKSGGDPRL